MIQERNPNSTGLRSFYREALAYAEDYYPAMLEHFRSPDDVRFAKMTRRSFYADYVYAVYTSGFNADTIEQLRPRLKRALKNYDVDAIAKMTSLTPVLEVFGNHRKAECVVNGARLLASVDFAEFKSRLREEGPSYLTQLPGIGKVTCDFLARNIGLASLAKNDTWIRQIVSGFDYTDHTAMVASLAEQFADKPGVVDVILWNYCADRAWRDNGFSSIDAYIDSLRS